jgi:hypothetical protein
MFRFLRMLMRRITANPPPRHIGRWGTVYCVNKQEQRVYWANMDH